MGFGEVHWNNWVTSYRCLSREERAAYQAKWEEQAGWEGFYAFIDLGTLRTWLIERERKIEAAAFPPSEEEREIREPARMQWMLRNYLKRPKTRVRLAKYGSRHEIFRDPSGAVWCLAIPDQPESLDVYLYRYDGELLGDDNLLVNRPLA